jgi:hypothetical protein
MDVLKTTEHLSRRSDEHKKATFTATAAKHVYVDDKSFQSDGTTYYRVVLSPAAAR